MNDLILNLKNPPIIEAVLDIECDFAPGFDMVPLQEAFQKALEDRYPKARPQFMQSFMIEAKQGEPVSHSAHQDLQAFQFLNEDERQIVQVRANGFSFNRLAPYTRLHDYLPEIRRTWEIYRATASPIQVRVVRLRYINRINLPLRSDGRVDLDDYFTIGPRLPDEDRLRLVGFLHQYLAVEEKSAYQVASVLTSQPILDGNLPVIFDNTAAAAAATVDPKDWHWLETTIEGLRALKNHVFRNTLTEECLNLFQQ